MAQDDDIASASAPSVLESASRPEADSLSRPRLSSLLASGRIQFASRVSGWQQAVRLCAEPLVEDGSVAPEYVDAVVSALSAPGGLYMDLGFGICLAHARPEAGARLPALSALLLERPVLLGDDLTHPISLFFCLSAPDRKGHLAVMSELATLLYDPDIRRSMLAAKSREQFQQALVASEEKTHENTGQHTGLKSEGATTAQD